MRVSLIVGSERIELGQDPPTIRAASVIVEVDEIASAAGVRLDGKPLALAFDADLRRATAVVDLARYTGYHQLIVPPAHRFVFGTEDAKLRIAGVTEMLDFLRSAGLAWQGALQFSGTDRVLRDLRLDAAWLEANVPEIVELADAVSRRPATSMRTRYRRATSGIPALGRTVQLLRRERDLLELHPKGPILVDGERWAPREIVVRQRQPAIETIGNRRATRLLVYATALARSVAEAMSSDTTNLFGPIIGDLERRLLLEPFKTLQRRRLYRTLPSQPREEELFDNRYREVWRLTRALEDERHWSPRQELLPEYAFATYADQVYQAFVATAIAGALGLATAKPLGGTGPHFSDARFDLYVNTTPPEAVLANWRSTTSRPSPLRPDLFLHDRTEDKVMIADAKYRNDGDRASSDSLNEAQLYLQAYGITAAAIIYPPQSGPPAWEAALVEASGFTLLEFPVRPAKGLFEWLEVEGRAALFSLFR